MDIDIEVLDELKFEHQDRIPKLIYHGEFMNPYYDYEDMDSYYIWIAKVKRFLEINYPNDKHVEEFEKISEEEIGPDQQRKLLAILEAYTSFPILVPNANTAKKLLDREAISVTTTINNSNMQEQNQQQSLAVELFHEAIRDDLTGRQIKELKAVVAEEDNDLKKARPKIIEKLKSFGTDVASNIVANLLTNPAIWNGL